MRIVALTHREQVGLIIAGVVLLALLVRALIRRRALTRRLSSVSARLVGSSALAVDGRGGLERALARLEHAAQEGSLKVSEASENRDRLTAALDRVAVGVVVWDEHGNEVCRNERAGAVLGEAYAEAIATELVERLLRDALIGRATSETLELFGPPRRTLAVSAFPLDDGRRSLGAGAIIEDVSERRLLEAVRRDFVANISHELKTPVGALGLLAETIVDEKDTAIIRRLSARMHNESMRLARIIDDLLDLSRIEAEESPAREPVPVHLVVAEAIDRVRQAAEHRKVALDVDEPDHRLTVLGDRRQLVSAVHNLLENAVKYSDAGATVDCSVEVDGDTVSVIVRDHGIGIPTRDLERIFERFYRVDRARSRETGGTGLGLAIVRHVAAHHGGDVTVTSEEGVGSTFALRLPSGPAARRTVTRRAG